MAISSRVALGLGLGLLGAAGLMGVTYGQQGDGAVRKTAGTQGAAGTNAAAPSAMKPTIIATIDLEAVVRGYEKAKYQAEQLQGEVLAKMGQLKAIGVEAQQVAKEMETFQTGTKDFKDRNAKLNELKVKLESGKQTFQGEARMKEMELMGGFYKEAQDMIARYAKHRGITCVVQISTAPVKTDDPDGVMQALGRSVVFSDPSMDITRSILWNMNKEYTESGGPIAKNPPGAAMTDDATTPASTEKAATTQPQPRQAAPGGGRPAPTKGQK